MNLQDTIKIHGYGAGTGSEPADSDYANTQTKNYLLKKQTHLNKLRKRSMPYPGGAFEDKKQILHGGGPGSGRKPGGEEQKYQVVDSDNNRFAVHKEGCIAAKKAVKQGYQDQGTYTGHSPSDAAQKFVNELDESHGGKGASGYTVDDVKIHNCAK
ncbi:MAG: hypothetical protein KGN01_08060 [Patescibacteria group bacterium]|nr:hypothetical protein [Patescibacteria group bacterium]